MAKVSNAQGTSEGGGMLKVRFDQYINQNTEKINDVSRTHIPLKITALMNDFLKKCEIERCDVSEPLNADVCIKNLAATNVESLNKGGTEE